MLAVLVVLIALLTAIKTRFNEGFGDLELADTMTASTLTGPQTVFRVRYLILLVTDLAEHYAQIAGYMRILGLMPPSALPRPQQ